MVLSSSQVEISPESREITTFITSTGMYRYKRLMFGINCAPEIFQKIMEQLVAGCEGCLVFIDDLLIHGADMKEHDSRLEKVMKRLNTHGVLLNKSKCVFRTDRVNFLGHRLSKEGIEPAVDKLLAIKSFRPPVTPDELSGFLGLVNWVGKFIPNSATTAYPLRQLTKANTPFTWGDEQPLSNRSSNSCQIR